MGSEGRAGDYQLVPGGDPPHYILIAEQTGQRMKLPPGRWQIASKNGNAFIYAPSEAYTAWCSDLFRTAAEAPSPDSDADPPPDSSFEGPPDPVESSTDSEAEQMLRSLKAAPDMQTSSSGEDNADFAALFGRTFDLHGIPCASWSAAGHHTAEAQKSRFAGEETPTRKQLRQKRRQAQRQQAAETATSLAATSASTTSAPAASPTAAPPTSSSPALASNREKQASRRRRNAALRHTT